jgi:hypothetical protein
MIDRSEEPPVKFLAVVPRFLEVIVKRERCGD